MPSGNVLVAFVYFGALNSHEFLSKQTDLWISAYRKDQMPKTPVTGVAPVFVLCCHGNTSQ